MKIKTLFIAIVLSLASVAAYATPTVTETVTETVTATTTETATETVTGTNTPDWTATDSPTTTLTSTITMTATESPTITLTSTITLTFTITMTATNTPTPQAAVFAYPNPAYAGFVTIAYPIDPAKTAKQVEIILYSTDGEETGRVTDDAPNGYCRFDISKMSRGVYFYKTIIRYTDGSQTVKKHEKFAVVR